MTDAAQILRAARHRGLRIATAESCTGGMVAVALTDLAGSSDVFERGFVTYSNEAKVQMLGVTELTLTDHGAVSEAVARAMAEGALRNSHANVSVSITGVAGPDGGSNLKPVGLVHFACAKKGSQTLHIEQRFGDLGREMVRIRSVLTALDLLRQVVGERDQ